MRAFKLINTKGESWNLNDVDSFLHSIRGLGQDRQISYERIGNHSVKTKDVLKQKSITGKIAFDGYNEYSAFCRFAQHRPLVMYYTASGETYQIRVELEKLSKADLENIGLQCDVTLKGLTTWYKMIHVENTRDTDGKKYPWTYPFTYTDNAMGEMSFSADSVEESPVKLSIMGPCTNPTWAIYTNGIVTATGHVNCTIEEGNRLVVDATSVPFEIAERDAAGGMVKDWYQESDFGTQRFLMAGYGENRITVVHEGSEDIRASAEVMVEYEAT